MFRLFLNCIGFLLAFIFTEKVMYGIWCMKNIIYSSIVRFHFQTIGKGGRFCYPLILNGGKNVSIGAGFSLRERGRIEAIDLYQGVNYAPSIIIGDNVAMGSDVHIGAIGRIVIGNNVLLGSRVFISDHSHGRLDVTDINEVAIKRKLYSKGDIIIEDNVWIGEGCIILPNVKIGQNSIIGANAVVTKDVPQNSIVVGNPGRVIRQIG